MNYTANVLSQVAANDNFRKVLFTGAKSQLVVMSLKPGEDIGEEVHEHVEQILFNFSGTGKAILDGQESPFVPGNVVIVAPGTKHNLMNTGDEVMKIYTIYVPANHIDLTVHPTKAAAEADVNDEEFGHQVR